MTIMVDVSIIICTHNPRPHYLGRVLEALRNQTLSSERWELLLVDNASDEPLNWKMCDLSWHPHARYLREEKLGLAWARLRGMHEAIADTLIFVDDDNVLESNYLSEAMQIKCKWPILGVWGSAEIIPEFELQPANNLKEFMQMLALRDIKVPQWSNVFSCVGAMPWGAGQCMRASVALAYRQYFHDSPIKVCDRSGGTLGSGGDLEIDYVACSMGLGVGIFPSLKLIHLIPKERIKEGYLVRLAEGMATSDLLLGYKWEKSNPPSPFSGVLGLLRVVVHLIFLRGIHWRMYVARLRATLRARAIIRESARALPYHKDQSWRAAIKSVMHGAGLWP
jgi:glycosyltransferase involved in cell wall biosynthesis